MTFALLLLAAGANLQAGCIPTSCTEIGCTDHVTFVIRDGAKVYVASVPAVIDACVDSDCGTFELYEENGKLLCSSPAESWCEVQDGGDIRIDFNLPIDKGSVTAKITITDAGGATLLEGTTDVETEDQYPNGEACGAVCVAGEAEFHAQ